MALPTVQQLEELAATEIRGLLGVPGEKHVRTAIQQLEIDREQRRKNMPSMHDPLRGQSRSDIQEIMNLMKERYPNAWSQTMRRSTSLEQHYDYMRRELRSPAFDDIMLEFHHRRNMPQHMLKGSLNFGEASPTQFIPVNKLEPKIDHGSDHFGNELLLLLPTP